MVASPFIQIGPLEESWACDLKLYIRWFAFILCQIVLASEHFSTSQNAKRKSAPDQAHFHL